MVNYQVQYRQNVKSDITEQTTSWLVMSEHGTLKSATNFAKVLVQKHGSDAIRVCRAMTMVVKIDLES